jgi:hypothetical protein
MAEKEIYRVVVPEDQLTCDPKMYDPTPREYRVVIRDDTLSPCVIYGGYRDELSKNHKNLWLVRHLIEELNEAVTALRYLDKAGMIPQRDSLPRKTHTDVGYATKMARMVMSKHKIPIINKDSDCCLHCTVVRNDDECSGKEPCKPRLRHMIGLLSAGKAALYDQLIEVAELLDCPPDAPLNNWIKGLKNTGHLDLNFEQKEEEKK